MGKVSKKKKRRSVDWTGEVIWGGDYKVGGKVGSGTFADCYEGRAKGGKRVCMKFEERASKKLEAEFKILTALGTDNTTLTPRALDLLQLSKANVMVIDLLGPSLDALIKKGTGTFSVNTTAMIGAAIMDCIEHVHNCGFLHRDIKPHNFVIGHEGFRHKVYIIDFGLAKSYLTPDGKHGPYKTDRSFIGTARYVSINTHRGHEQGRRDDLESIGYILIYFLKGKLPWQGVGTKQEKKVRLDMICDVKAATQSRALCEGIPPIFASYLSYAKGLQFKARPEYQQLKKLFQSLYDPAVQPDWCANGLAHKITEDLRIRSEQHLNVDSPSAASTQLASPLSD